MKDSDRAFQALCTIRHMNVLDTFVNESYDSISRLNHANERDKRKDSGHCGTAHRRARLRGHVIAPSNCRAGVNLAAVHYHFGSKEDLLDAVVARKVTPVNEERMAWLERVEAAAGGGPLQVEDVLEAFFLPTAEVAGRSPEFVRLMGRMLTEGMMPRIVEKHFQCDGAAFRWGTQAGGAGIAPGRIDVAGPLHGWRDGAHHVPVHRSFRKWRGMRRTWNCG